MATAIHIEVNVLFLLILFVIAWQITHSVSHQTDRILFRYVVNGIIILLTLDALWLLVDGKMFPGAIFLNKIINAFFLGLGTVMGGVWYMYILQILGYKLSRPIKWIIMVPGTIFLILNLISIKTGWIFYVTEENIYMRGSWFPAQSVASLFMLFLSLIHILIFLFFPQKGISQKTVHQLLSYYFVPVFGTLATLPFQGMPGTWTCCSVSVILMYMNAQDNAILRDSLTGLNNRKTLDSAFSEYKHRITEVKNLYLFMLDLNQFKLINDRHGHTVGDEALKEASTLITSSVKDIQGVVARYGGDEFVILGFFFGEPNAIHFKKQIKENFERWNETHDAPYVLSTSVGFSRYKDGQNLQDLLETADINLYEDKQRH